MSALGLHDHDVLATAQSWLAEGHPAALATVLQTWGSAPRRAGSHLAIRGDGLFVGSVSGGCVERAVVEVAQEVMRAGQPQLVEYGVSNEDAWEVGLACGGTIRVGVASLAPAREALAQTVAATADRRPVALALDFGAAEPLSCVTPSQPAWSAEVEAAYVKGRELTGPENRDQRFVRLYAPPLKLYVIGAVHIARALVPMARLAGYDVTVIDPRGAFARPEAWEGVEVRDDYPDEAFEALGLDRRCAVAALTHDPKIDDPGLIAALHSDAFYVGALGSKQTHAQRLTRLGEAGLSQDALTRIHGPIGLALGAGNPAEIAVAILAQVTQVLRT